MKLSIVSFGKLKTPGYTAAAEHHLRLLQFWQDASVVELRPTEKSSGDRDQESQALLQWIARAGGPRHKLILLDETGVNWSSETWAERIGHYRDTGVTPVIFAVGGAFGWNDDVKRKAHALVSFGQQTTTHELARILLIEQIYRAYSILNAHPYHHGK